MKWGENTGIGRLIPGGQVVRINGLVPPEAPGFAKITVVGATFLSLSSVVDLGLDELSRVLCHQPVTADSLFNLVELCAGAGLSSVGFQRVGFRHRCAVELQPSLAELHRQLHPDVPVVCADITVDATACAIFDHCSEPCTLMSGVACQPYSQGGLQMGEQDQRAGTLPGTFRLRHLLQAPILAVECVQPAQTNQFVQDHVKAMEWQLGMHVAQCSLRLEHVWSACRLRWWMLASEAGLGKIKIPEFPAHCSLVVRDLMPVVPRWPATEEDQLRLTELELQRFQVAKAPLNSYEVKADKKLPTALHSWGGQLQACACGCRSSGFSDALLASKGVYAQLVKILATDDHPMTWRHLHVLEVSVLSGVPLNLAWGPDARLNLCAIGQMAAPMQAIWIASAIVRHVQALFTTDPMLDPLHALNALKKEIWDQSKEIFRPEVPRAPALPESVQFVHVQVALGDDAPCVVRVPASATVQQLVRAECALHGLVNCHVMDFDGQPVSLDFRLSEAPRLRLSPVGPLPLLDQPMPIAATAIDPDQDLQESSEVTAAPMELADVDMHDAPIGLDAVGPFAMGETINMPVDALMDSLMQLTPNQLMALLPPIVIDPVLCTTMRRNVLTHEARFNLLARQEAIWADDEILWHLRNMSPAEGEPPCAILDPLLASSWCVAGTLDLVQVCVNSRPSFTRLASVVLVNGHWTPCLWVVRASSLDVHLWEHDDTDINTLNQLHGLLSRALGLKYAAISLRADFALEHEDARRLPRPWCWGGAIPELDAVVSTLLQQHGVPAAAAGARARLVIQALGRDQVSQAMHGVAPWKSLKQLANQQQLILQLVLPDELAAVVNGRKAHQSRTKDKKSPASQQKGPRVYPQKPLDIDPARLELACNTFCLGDGTPVEQLAINQVGPLASGIALVTYSDAQQFLQSGRILTRRGLALLVLNGPAELQTDLQWSSIRFAAKCSVNQQPILLSGYLVQLGEDVVCPYFKTDGQQVPDVPVSCARITVFRDQLPQEWSTFADHPFRHIIALIPPLQTCRVDPCQCDKWHVAQADSGEVLLDVFRRQFFTDGGRPTKSAQASHFSVQVRFLKSQQLTMLRLSGVNGIYVEPRLPDSSAPSDEFQVVWLPQATFATAQHEAQCEPASLGLARSGKRYGIRVKAMHFQQLFQKLKPEGQFLAPGVKQNWCCGPWPYGTDRKSLARIFAEWNWQARPLQPAKPINGGVMWIVQSVADPPNAVWNMKHGQVVVSKCESANAAMTDQGDVAGPQGTVELCSTASASDPWLVEDPWQTTLRQIPINPAPSMINQLQEIEERLEKSLMDKLPQDRMETDENEQRIQLLEQQVQTLAQRHQSLESTVHENHRQNTAQMQSLQTQMVTQMEASRTQMAHMFQDQMSKLETVDQATSTTPKLQPLGTTSLLHSHQPIGFAWTFALEEHLLSSTGFRPSFQRWWTNRDCVGLQDPCCVPDAPPAPAVACLERNLIAAKKSTRTSDHKRNPNLIYQDTKRPMPEPVSTLLSVCRSQVVAVDHDDAAVDIEPCQPFDPDKPVVVGHHTVGLIHVDDSRLYLDDVSVTQSGMTISQSSPVGSLDAVFAAFHEQWKKRWCRHDEVPHSRWQQLVDFARAHVPSHPTVDVPVSPELLRAEVARKKPSAATGLDGVSRSDLLQADNNLLASYCSMYERAGSDGSWPAQVLTGRVASLAKVDTPESTSDYRPITIFSLGYRAFSSLKARALLDWASSWCHPDVFGNRKHHQTAQLWRHIVTAIQTAYDQNQPLSGLMADIEKCFNCLPRWLILALAVHAGVPHSTCCAWAGALAGMTRRFKVQESFSCGFTTSTGLAEGCALSCLGMLLLDDLMHRFITFNQPALRVLSFVDDWSFLTSSTPAALRQMDLLLSFASLADLTVDRRKTFLWSTCPEIRGQFRRLGCPVVHQAKDLGAHIAFSRQRTNRTVVERLEALQPLWRQLKFSRAGYLGKLRALRTVAWPRGLYAVESAPIAAGVWTTHRRQAIQALNFDKPGINPLLLLGLVESYADPEFLAVVRTVAETRLNCPLDFWACELYMAAAGHLVSPPSTPVSVLLERILPLGFAVLHDGSWRDRIGSFHPGQINYTELCHRIQWQWNQLVASRLAHRKDFTGLPQVDVLLTRKKLYQLPVDQQALMRMSLAGALFTQDAHSHWNGEDGACKWCGAADSLQHRYFERPNTRDLREQLAPLVVQHRANIPDAMGLRTWAILPPTHWTWLSALDCLPRTVPSVCVPLLPETWNYVFTDGSWFWQADPSLRVAAWGALVATPLTPDWTFTCRGALCSGWLPGLCQSAYRAELFALAVVLHHASSGCFRVKIFSDCLGVVNKYHLLTQGNVQLKPNSANGDLWRWVLDSVEALGLDNVVLVKTPAHRRVSAAKTGKEAWMFWNNNAVDQLARLANVNRPSQVWRLWEQHAREVVAARELYDQVCALHLAVAQRSVIADNDRTLDECPPEPAAPRPTRQFVPHFDLGGWDGTVPLKFANEFGQGMSHRLARWWLTRTQGADAGNVRWITVAHLYIDYQLTWGCPGPIKHGKQWLDATLRPYLEPERHDFLLRLKWFKRCLKLLWTSTGQSIALATCRGEGEAIQSFIASASVRWSQTTWELEEAWFLRQCKGPVSRGTKMLQCLPLAQIQGRHLAEMYCLGELGLETNLEAAEELLSRWAQRELLRTCLATPPEFEIISRQCFALDFQQWLESRGERFPVALEDFPDRLETFAADFGNEKYFWRSPSGELAGTVARLRVARNDLTTSELVLGWQRYLRLRRMAPWSSRAWLAFEDSGLSEAEERHLLEVATGQVAAIFVAMLAAWTCVFTCSLRMALAAACSGGFCLLAFFLCRPLIPQSAVLQLWCLLVLVVTLVAPVTRFLFFYSGARNGPGRRVKNERSNSFEIQDTMDLASIGLPRVSTQQESIPRSQTQRLLSVETDLTAQLQKEQEDQRRLAQVAAERKEMQSLFRPSAIQSERRNRSTTALCHSLEITMGLVLSLIFSWLTLWSAAPDALAQVARIFPVLAVILLTVILCVSPVLILAGLGASRVWRQAIMAYMGAITGFFLSPRTLILAMEDELGPAGYTQLPPSVSSLRPLIVEKWEDGSVEAVKFWQARTFTATAPFRGQVDVRNTTQDLCELHVLCFKEDGYQCGISGWKRLGSAAYPLARRLSPASPVVTAFPRRLQGELVTQTVPTPVDVTVIWGIRSARSTPLVGPPSEFWSYDPNFVPQNPWAQRAIRNMCSGLTKSNDIKCAIAKKGGVVFQTSNAPLLFLIEPDESILLEDVTYQ
eukprot:s358_g5.t1